MNASNRILIILLISTALAWSYNAFVSSILAANTEDSHGITDNGGEDGMQEPGVTDATNGPVSVGDGAEESAEATDQPIDAGGFDAPILTDELENPETEEPAQATDTPEEPALETDAPEEPAQATDTPAESAQATDAPEEPALATDAPEEPAQATDTPEPDEETDIAEASEATIAVELEAVTDAAEPAQAAQEPVPNAGVLTQGIAPTAYAVDGESIVVYSFDELKTALSGNNNYVNVYLGADIDMKPLGIEIHSSKKSVLISGISPLDGSGPFTVNEYNSLDAGYTIRVTSNTGTKEVIMRDLNIIGRNYYGAVCVYDTAYDVRVTFENVGYNGPQISYNRGGTVCITGASDIRITGDNGMSAAQELVETNALELGGSTVINHYAPVLSGIWLVGSGAYIKVLPGANVTWNETGTYMIYQDSTNPAALTLEQGARLTVNTTGGLFYNTSVIYHQFGNVSIDAGAALEIRQQGISGTPVLKVNNGISVQEGGSLVILAQSAPQLLYMTGAADITVQTPDTLALYNKTGKLIEWSGTGNHTVSVISTFLNYWSVPCELSMLGGFDDLPQYRWRRRNGELLAVEITAAAATTKAVVSNYTSADYGAAPDEGTLSLADAKALTAGRLRLSIDVITDTARYISGQTEPYAELCAVYTDSGGVLRRAYGSADSGGAYDIGLTHDNPPALDTEAVVYGSVGYKSVYENATVVNTPLNALEFMHVPNDLVFPKTDITAKKELVPRADADWHIIIGDTRGQGAKWDLYVRLTAALTGGLHQLEDAVLFKADDGSITTLGSTAVKAASGVKGDDTETVVSWPADGGIMLYVDTLRVYTGVGYRAAIEWLLVDAP